MSITTDAERSRFDSPRDARMFATQHGLRSCEEVAAMWEAKHGEKLTKSRVHQLQQYAESKLRALPGIENLLDADRDDYAPEEVEGSLCSGIIDAMESVLYSGVGLEAFAPRELRHLSTVSLKMANKIEKLEGEAK